MMMNNHFAKLFLTLLITLSSINHNAARGLDPSPYSEEVVELGDDQFDDITTGENAKWFVYFHEMKGVRNIKILRTIWEPLAHDLITKYDHSKVFAAKVLGPTANPKLIERFDITEYPTMLFFADNKMYKYEGEPLIPELTEFALHTYNTTQAFDIPQEVIPPMWEQAQGTVYKVLGLGVSAFGSIIGDETLVEDVEHVLKFRKNAMLVVFFTGLFLGGLIINNLQSEKKSSKIKKE